MIERGPTWLVAALAAAGALCLVLAGPAAAQEPKAPAIHQNITEYTGPGTCATCHPNEAKEVVSSLHYQQVGEPQFLDGWEKGKLAGMMVSF